ncbi:MAG: hypothetical protein Q8P44_03520, partial [Dehalococcoidia bacterium]|nr:hypothetical protein [Dehalococcoidia bacterium]
MKNKYFYIIVSLVVGLIVLMVAGCGGQGGPGAGSTGKIEVRATDAPPEGVSRIMVTAENIQVHRSGASENSWIT